MDDSELLLPWLEDVTVVKYRRLKTVPLKTLCLSIFMLESGGMFFSWSSGVVAVTIC